MKAKTADIVVVHGGQDTAKAESLVKSEVVSAGKLLQHAEALTIVSVGDYELADSGLKAVKGRWREVEAARVKVTAPLNGVLDYWNALFKRPLGFLKQAEATYKAKMLGWQAAERQRVKEEQERLWLAAQAEEAKLRERAEKRAVKAEERGDLAKAEMIRETMPVVPVAEAAPVRVPKIPGNRQPIYWKVEVVDLELFVKAWLAGEVPKAAVLADQVYLNSVVREQRDTLRWPGLRVWSEEGLSSGRA